MPRHVDQPLAICKRLLAVRAERDASVRPHRLKQRGDCLSDRAIVASDVKESQDIERIGDLDRDGVESRALDHAHRIEPAGLEVTVVAHLLPEDEESLIANSEEWASKRREDLKLVIRPLDRRKGVAKRDDFLAIVKRTPTDKNVGNASSFKSANIGSRSVNPEIAESAEEDSNVTRSNGGRAAIFLDRPTTVIDLPSDERSDRFRV